MVVTVESKNCRNRNSRENQLQSQGGVVRELETEMIETIQLLVRQVLKCNLESSRPRWGGGEVLQNCQIKEERAHVLQ